MSAEFDFIDKLTGSLPVFHDLKVGVGDDAAVLPDGTLVTVDTLVENDHFTLEWSSPQQVGRKAMEVNVSDIVAMGGLPTYAFISIVRSSQTPLEWFEGLYNGIDEVCRKYEISVAGGDTTHGAVNMISVTLFGTSLNPCLRSGACEGDFICVTGEVGGSTAGYRALKSGINKSELSPYLLKRHLEPEARLEASRKISVFASAMIDVSDGVASEVRHIAKQSGLGARIYEEKIPIRSDVFDMEKQLNLEPYSCALSGGEDFELLFTIAPGSLDKLRAEFADFSVIGEMLGDESCLEVIDKSKTPRALPGGFDHITI